MALIGSLEIGAAINTAQLGKSAHSAAGTIRTFGSSLSSALTEFGGQASSAVSGLSSSLGGLGKMALAEIGLALTTAGISALVKSAANGVAEFKALSDRLGVTGAELKKLHFVATMLHTDVGAVDTGLAKMQRTLGEAANGNKEAAATFSRLGLDVRDLVRMGPAQAFEKVAGAIGKIPNTSQQAAAAVDVFGRGAMEMMNVLRAGPEKLQGFSAEMKRLTGDAFSAFDKGKLLVVDESFIRFGVALSTLKNSVAAMFEPAVEMVVNAFTDLVAAVNDSTTWLGWFRAKVGETFETVYQVLRNAGPYFELLKLYAEESFRNVLAIAQTLPENFGRVFAWLGRNWWNLLTDWVSMWKTVAGNIFDNVKILGASIGDYLGSIDWGKHFVQPIVDGFKLVLQKAKDFGQAVWAAIQGKDWGKLFSADLSGAFKPAENHEFKFKGLLDGFKATTEELPGLIDPVWVDMGEKIGAQFGLIKSNQEKYRKELEAKAKGAPGVAGEGSVQGQEKGGPKLAGLAELGSKEAYSALVKFQTAGAMKDRKPLEDVAKNSREQTTLQRQIVAAMQRQSLSFGTFRMA